MEPIIITLPQPKEVVIVEQQTKTVSEVEFVEFKDDRTECLASVKIDGVIKQLVLWSSNTTPTYEEVGQYEDADVDARIAQVVSEL
jgi:hypothetical protein